MIGGGCNCYLYAVGADPQLADQDERTPQMAAVNYCEDRKAEHVQIDCASRGRTTRENLSYFETKDWEACRNCTTQISSVFVVS